jgi:ATP-dependent Clp protease protease subunit
MRDLIVLVVGVIGLTVAGTMAFSTYQDNQKLPDISSRPSESIPAIEAPNTKGEVKLHNLDLNKGNVVLLVDEVNTDTVNVAIERIRNFNNEFPGKPIYLLLDSPGGSVLDGARLISTMQASKSPVNTVCLQICASMAAMILEYGKERYAVDRSIVMFHPASISGMISSELDKVVSRYQFLQRYVDKMDRYVAARSGSTYESFKARSNRELWIDAEDALANNLIDKIVRVELTTKEMTDFAQNKMRDKIVLIW